MKFPLGVPVPPLILHAGFTTRLLKLGLVIVHVTSLNENPEPVALTMVPICPEAGVSVIDAPMTVNVAWAESVTPPFVPVAVMTYGPGATFFTVKLPFTIPVPSAMVHAARLTGVPVIEQVLSVVRNPVPVTLTNAPMGPIAGVSVIVGPAVTLNVPVAKSGPPAAPLTVTL